jgi:hypothetical protein
VSDAQSAEMTAAAFFLGWRYAGATSHKGNSRMSNASMHEETQLLARMTVLELVVGMMISDSMVKSGKGPEDILGFGESVKKLLRGRTPKGATDTELSEAADAFFSHIASQMGSQERRSD